MKAKGGGKEQAESGSWIARNRTNHDAKSETYSSPASKADFSFIANFMKEGL